MHNLSLKETQREWHGTLKSYLIGFVASLILTSLSFGIVLTQFLLGPTLVYTLIGLAVAQTIVQLIFFLHIGQEAKPRWETFIFCFTVLILLIIVIGSLWIMNDLDDRMMGNMPHEMTHD